jgi:hypothetical protein
MTRFIGAAAIWLLPAGAALFAAEPAFELSYPANVHSEPFTGRVYVFFTKMRNEPRFGPGWFNTQPFVSLDVTDWKPDTPLAITVSTQGLLAYPKPLAEMALDGFKAQAVARFDPRDRNVGVGVGNAYSATAELQANRPEPVKFRLDSVVPPREFRDTKWSKQVEVRSKLLSDFHGREVSLRGAVLLPASYYDQPDRRYPVIYEIPGFGGTHYEARREEPLKEQNEGGVEFLRVVLDPSCPLGHHVFADSANNGPVGQALTTEFIPEFERRYRAISEPTARFLNGHSSGGWSSLWLQVTYPEFFGGVWSQAPDPVDFRDFQRINLYRAGENMYRTPAGERRPIARKGDEPLLWYDDFVKMETVLGPGGQIYSFEGVFSPRGADGRPRLLFDRETGAIDTEVAQTWRKYDIRLILAENWPALEPRLRGKLHVFMGDLDTFYLEGATHLLKDTLTNLKSDAVVEFFPGKDHGNFVTPEFRQRVRREMTSAFLRSRSAEAAR